MDIDSLKVDDKLECISDYKNKWGSCDSVAQHLSISQQYTLEKFEVHSWHTKLWFKEKPGLVFNSVHFKKVET